MVDVITETATKWLMGGGVYGVDTLDQGEEQSVQDSVKFHHAAQNSTQFETYELFIFRIFHLICLDHGWPQVPKKAESKTMGGGVVIFSKVNVFLILETVLNVYLQKDAKVSFSKNDCNYR